MTTQISENWDTPNGCWKAVLDRFVIDEDRPSRPRLIFRTIPQHGLDKEYFAEMRFTSDEHYEKQMTRWLSVAECIGNKIGKAEPYTYLGEFLGRVAKIDVGFEANEVPLFDSKITGIRWSGTPPGLLAQFNFFDTFMKLPESET